MDMKEMIEQNMKKQADIVAKEVNTIRDMCDYCIEDNCEDHLSDFFDYLNDYGDRILWAIGYKHAMNCMTFWNVFSITDREWEKEYCQAKDSRTEGAGQGGVEGILNQAYNQGLMDFIELHHPEVLHGKKVE